MSYSVSVPCWNCKKQGEGTCKDGTHLQEGINEKIHNDYETHKGSGQVMLMCSKVEPLQK